MLKDQYSLDHTIFLIKQKCNEIALWDKYLQEDKAEAELRNIIEDMKRQAEGQLKILQILHRFYAVKLGLFQGEIR